MAETPGAVAAESRRARRFGWTWLLLWVLVGIAIEAAHGFKLASYLDDGLTRTLLRLGHAHGVILSLVVLAYAALGVEAAPSAGRFLRWGAGLIPVGFTASAFRHSEGDPALVVLLVPVGAVPLAIGLMLLARSAWRR